MPFPVRSVLIAALLSVLGLLGPERAYGQSFAELSPAERSILSPLAGEWDAMSAARKKKWRELAERYPRLTDEEKQRLTARMQGWARMSPEDRRAARDQFRAMQGADALRPEAREQLKQQWQRYRDLPPEERSRLLAQHGMTAQPNRNAETVKRLGAPPLPDPPGPSSANAPTTGRVVTPGVRPAR